MAGMRVPLMHVKLEQCPTKPSALNTFLVTALPAGCNGACIVDDSPVPHALCMLSATADRTGGMVVVK